MYPNFQFTWIWEDWRALHPDRIQTPLCWLLNWCTYQVEESNIFKHKKPADRAGSKNITWNGDEPAPYELGSFLRAIEQTFIFLKNIWQKRLKFGDRGFQ